MAIITRDSSGQLWQVAVNPDGSITASAATSDLPFSGPVISTDVNGQLWQITVNTDGSVTTTQISSAPAGSSTLEQASLFRDSSGQLWQITVNPTGSLTTTPLSDAPPVSTATDGCTVTLQNVVNLCSTHVDLMPLANVGGYSQEPALSLANDTIQELLAAPYDWKFNSVEAPLLVTQAARQDYLFAGASAFVIGVGGVSIGLASGDAITQVGTTTTVECLQPHPFSVGQTVYMTGNVLAAYNSTYSDTAVSSGWSGGWAITATPDPFTFVFEHTTAGLGASGAPGITDLGWLSGATMYDTASTSPVPWVWDLTAVKTLKRSGQTGRPRKINLVSQSAGVLKFRIDFIPGATVYGITLIYQKKAPLKTDLTQTWAPFPDELGFVYRQMFLARCYRFLDKPRADNEYAKAAAMIAKALDRDDVEMSDQYVTPERSLMGGDIW